MNDVSGRCALGQTTWKMHIEKASCGQIVEEQSFRCTTCMIEASFWESVECSWFARVGVSEGALSEVSTQDTHPKSEKISVPSFAKDMSEDIPTSGSM